MAELPADIIYDILSRMPVKSLDRFRSVCKQWCKYIDEPKLAIIQMNRAVEEPIPIMYKRPIAATPPGPNLRKKRKSPSVRQKTLITLFDIIKSKEGTTTTIPKAKKKSVLEFDCNGPFPEDIHNVRGSCNGLLYLSKYNYPETTLSVVHPLRDERYELPPIMSMQSCGLGYDASTNTFKMCASVHEEENYKIVHTMVHVLGTDSWREIPQIPYYRMTGHGIYAHGCLHWLGYHNQMPHASWSGHLIQFPPTYRFKVICFDIKEEKFGAIDPPREIGDDDWAESNLVNLHGEIGLVYVSRSDSQELWILKENKWVIHCRFVLPTLLFCDWIAIVGLWNKYGDILLTADGGKLLFVYNLKSRGFHQVNLVGWEDGCKSYIHMCQSSLFSIPGMKKKSAPQSSNPTNFNLCSSKKRRRRITRIQSKVIYRFLNFAR